MVLVVLVVLVVWAERAEKAKWGETGVEEERMRRGKRQDTKRVVVKGTGARLRTRCCRASSPPVSAVACRGFRIRFSPPVAVTSSAFTT